MTMIPFTGDSQALSLLWRIWSAYTHTQKIMQIKNPSHYANKNYSTTHKFMLVFMTVTHHRKPNFHQIEEKKNKPHHFWAVEGDPIATHTSHLNQLANTALKAVCHSMIFTRAATKHEAVRTMICYPLHQCEARVTPKPAEEQHWIYSKTIYSAMGFPISSLWFSY